LISVEMHPRRSRSAYPCYARYRSAVLLSGPILNAPTDRPHRWGWWSPWLQSRKAATGDVWRGDTCCPPSPPTDRSGV